MTDFTPFEQMLRGHAGLLEDTTHDRWTRAQSLFEERAYRESAALLTDLLAELEGSTDEATLVRHQLTDARLLLARALFHSAQLDGAIRVARELLEHDPGEAYAHLLIGRSLQRQGHREEAAGHLKLAEALGGYA